MTDFKKLTEDALYLPHASKETLTLDLATRINELAHAVFVLLQTNTTLLHERTLAYNDLTVANLEVRNLRERLAGGKLD